MQQTMISATVAQSVCILVGFWENLVVIDIDWQMLAIYNYNNHKIIADE